MATDPKTQLFVSSTSDLADERQAVRDALSDHDVSVYLYEEEVAGVGAPRERLRKVLSRSEVYVGLLGSRFGSPLPDCSQGRSIVEWEFDQAVETPGTAIFAFTNTDGGRLAEPEQARLIQKIRDFDSEWLKEFADVGELKKEVRRAYNYYLARFKRLLTERLLEEKQKGEKDPNGQPRKITRIRNTIVLACMAALTAIGVASVAGLLVWTDALVLAFVSTAVAVCSILLNDY